MKMGMGCKKKILICWFIVVTFFVLVMGFSNMQEMEPKPKVPCFFIFGDSLLDSGNNNNLSTLAKVNYPPYGIDFPDGPTGRFCNGRTTADFFAKYLGFKNFIPPFTTAKGEEILQGVNYASGSAGIRDETGTNLGVNSCFNKQLENHKITISRIVSLLKHKNLATQHLKKCIYLVGMGSNDYINNYYRPDFSPTSRIYSPEQYATVLIQQYCQQLSTLYGLGARKVALSGLLPIGCTPDAITSKGTMGKLCVKEQNDAIIIFNDKLKQLVDELNEKFKDARFIYLENFGPLFQLISTIDTDYQLRGCCEVEKQSGLCVPNKDPCFDRNLYLFFDSIHPSEAYNFLLASLQQFLFSCFLF